MSFLQSMEQRVYLMRFLLNLLASYATGASGGETEQQQGMADSLPLTHLRTPLIQDRVRQLSVNILMDAVVMWPYREINISQSLTVGPKG